jgi:hypothetical protein
VALPLEGRDPVSIEDIYYVSQIISVVAVIASLIYLSLQVRQTERNQRAMMQQGRADRVSDAVMRTSDPQMSGVFQKGSRCPETLSPEEVDRYILICPRYLHQCRRFILAAHRGAVRRVGL